MVFLLRRPLNVLKDSWAWESSIPKSVRRLPFVAFRERTFVAFRERSASWLLCYGQSQFDFSLLGNLAVTNFNRFRRRS